MAVLEHNNSNDDENQYIPDTSCDLQSVKTNCHVIRRSFLAFSTFVSYENTYVSPTPYIVTSLTVYSILLVRVDDFV